jgi:NAD(P)-dependent dehydrogenase (short-subunit alcohol dehydrogenase family)
MGIALRFAKEGARVAIADTNKKAAEQVADKVREQGGEALAFQMDIRNSEDAVKTVRDVIDVWRQVTILVNNAGIGGLTTFLLAGVTLISALLGLSIGRLSGSAQASLQGLSPTNLLLTRFRWNWPWYLIALVSLAVTLVWCNTISSTLPPHTLTVVLVLFSGALLLLLPTLWSSFDRVEVFPTLLLAAESLLLLVLGTIVRIRFFILSGAALVVVSAIHLLFLPALGMPTFLALILAGTLLLALATILLVIRTRLATVWSELS